MKCVNQRYYINNTMYNWKKEKEEKEKKRRKKILGRRKSEYCYGGTAIDKREVIHIMLSAYNSTVVMLITR